MRIAKGGLHVHPRLVARYAVDTDAVAAMAVDAVPLLMVPDSGAEFLGFSNVEKQMTALAIFHRTLGEDVNGAHVFERRISTVGREGVFGPSRREGRVS